MKKRLYLLLPVLVLACFGLFTAFTEEGEQTPEVSIQDLIDAEVDRRIDQYRQIRIRRCNKKILDRASELADSNIMMQIRELYIDTIPRPVRTDRPLKPAIIQPIDTIREE